MLMYVDELIKENKLDKAIQVLKSNLCEDKYKNILYDIFYKYSNYDFDIYLKIKKIYDKVDWEEEKTKVIEEIKKNKYNSKILNQIYIEEKMYDDLFSNINNYNMDYVSEYEKYLLPKYNNELLNIYKSSCLNLAAKSNNRKTYREVAIQVNHIIYMNDSSKIVKEILSEINEEYFRNRPAMLDEFKNVIKNLEQYF